MKRRDQDSERIPTPAEQLAGTSLFAGSGPAPWDRFGPGFVQPPAARLTDPSTSHAAAEAYQADAEAQNAMIVACLQGMGKRGGTAPEIAEALGWTSVQVSRRIAALRAAQLVYSFDGKDGRPLVKREYPGHRPCAVHVGWKWRLELPPGDKVRAA